MTISDDVNPSQCSLLSDVFEPVEVAVAKTYWDYSLCCLMKVTTTPAGVQTEQSVMQPGKDGFADAVFADSNVIHAEVPNLDLFSVRKPAAHIMKKPAAAVLQAEKSDDIDSDMEDVESANSQTEMVVSKKPAASPKLVKAQHEEAEQPDEEAGEDLGIQPVDAKLFVFPNLTTMKLGLFTCQSYTTFKT